MKFEDLKNKADKNLQTTPINNFYNTSIAKMYKRKPTLLRSFQQAMDSADGTEIFTFDYQQWTCAVSNLKDNWNQDKKMIAIDNNSGVKVGSIISWDRTNTKWIITLQDYNIEDYFRGEIWKINHTINWFDELGKKHSADVSIQGPVETKAKYDDTRSISLIGRPNDTLELVMSGDDFKDLHRFDRIIVGDRAWRIQVIDDISNDDIVRMSLIEDYVNNEDNIQSQTPKPDSNTKIAWDDTERYCLVGPKDITTLDSEIEIRVSGGTLIPYYEQKFMLYINDKKIKEQDGGYFKDLELKENDKIKITYFYDNWLYIEWKNRVGGLL